MNTNNEIALVKTIGNIAQGGVAEKGDVLVTAVAEKGDKDCSLSLSISMTHDANGATAHFMTAKEWRSFAKQVEDILHAEENS